jgi:nucleotide-binding universal stress UspA family protein
MPTSSAPILLAFDSSGPAQRAFAYALDLAQRTGRPLHVVTVLDVAPEFAAGTGGADDALVRESEGALKELRQQAATAGIPLTSRVMVGPPALLLLQELQATDAAQVVIGHTEKGMLMRWLAGSVSRSLLDEARVPVTLVP